MDSPVGAPKRGHIAGKSARPSVLLLGILTAIDAMAIDTYVPALPAIRASFRTSASAAQATMAIFFIGVAVGQAFWGALSDRLGRRRPLLAGLVIFATASVAAAIAPTLEALMAARLGQAIGASAALALTRSIVSDLWPEKEAAKLYSVLMQVLGMTSLTSPLIGSALLIAGSWRLIFGALTLIGLGCLLWTSLRLHESLQSGHRRTASGTGSLKTVVGALAHAPGFPWSVVVAAFAMGTMFVSITGAAFIFIDRFGWSSTEYSLLYATTSLTFIVGCQVNNVMLRRHSAARLLKAGLAIQFVLSGLFAALALMRLGSAPVYAALMCALIGILGLTLGNSVSEAMRRAPAEHSGAASGAIGVLQFAVSGLTVPLSTMATDYILSVSLSTFACAAVTLFANTRSRV